MEIYSDNSAKENWNDDDYSDKNVKHRERGSFSFAHVDLSGVNSQRVSIEKRRLSKSAEKKKPGLSTKQIIMIIAIIIFGIGCILIIALCSYFFTVSSSYTASLSSYLLP